MLSEQQEKAIYLLVYSGLKKYQVAEEVGVHNSTISRWFNDADFAKRFDEEMRRSFSELAAEAKQTVYSIMVSGERESNRLAAAKDVLSRSGFDASQKVEQVGETTIRVSLDTMEGGDSAADSPTT